MCFCFALRLCLFLQLGWMGWSDILELCCLDCCNFEVSFA